MRKDKKEIGLVYIGKKKIHVWFHKEYENWLDRVKERLFCDSLREQKVAGRLQVRLQNGC